MTDTRDRILDAAARVMRGQGLARTTTKLIAREAGFSEATLYKHFQDKNELFLGVLKERLPPLNRLIGVLPERVGRRTVRENLEEVAAAAVDFYVEGLPIGGSLFSEPRLLAAFREDIGRRGLGPHIPRDRLAGYLAAERDLGRLRPDTDVHAMAALLLGACFQQAFLSHFTDKPRASDGDGGAETAAALVRTLLGPLLPEDDAAPGETHQADAPDA